MKSKRGVQDVTAEFTIQIMVSTSAMGKGTQNRSITDMKEKEFDENNNKTFIFAQYFPL